MHRRGDRPVQALLLGRRLARCAVPAGRRDAAVHADPDELPAHGTADYLVGGEWSKKAAASGRGIRQDQRRRHQRVDQLRPLAQQNEWKPIRDADYFHVCSNETVHGHRLPTWPKHPNLVVDASSEFMSRPHPVARLRAGLRRRAEEPRARRAWCWRSSARTSTEAEEGVPQALELQGPGREQEHDQHAADVRRVHPARDLPLARSPGRPGGDGEAQRRPRPS